MPRVAIGSHREVARLQRASTSDDGMGGQGAPTWTDVAQVWVAVGTPSVGQRETLAAAQVTALQAYAVDMRYRTGVRPSMRLLWRDKTLEIQSVVDVDMRRQRLQLLCSEVQ